MSHRLLSFPRPVVVASTGHAYAMGAFLVLSGDLRLGTTEPAYRITANEVAIGMTLPRAAIEICRQRLGPAAFERAVNLAEVFDPQAAREAGWLDELVPEPELLGVARARATSLAALDARAHRETKLRARASMLLALEAATEADDVEFRSVIDQVTRQA
jgi:enoyl-CoA hydratase